MEVPSLTSQIYFYLILKGLSFHGLEIGNIDKMFLEERFNIFGYCNAKIGS